MNYAKQYRRSSTTFKSDAAYFLNKFSNLLKWKPYKENILDVGCADGSLTTEVLHPFVKNHIEKIYGVDMSAAMIEHATNNNNIKNIEFRRMDITKDTCLKEMENKFDHIFSFSCAHWILDQRELMKRFYQMLKPNSQIFVTSLMNTPVHKIYQKFYEEEKWSKYWTKTSATFADYGENPAENMRKILQETGFDVNLSVRKPKNGIFDDYPGLVKAVTTAHPSFNAIPTEMQEEYIRDVTEEGFKHCTVIETPSKCDCSYESLVFIATKTT